MHGPNANAQVPGHSGDSMVCSRPDGHYFRSFATDAKDILISPVRWRSKGWITAAAVSGITVLLYTQDEAIRNAFQRNRTEGVDKANQYFLGHLGSWMVTVPLAAGFYGYGAIARNDRASQTGLKALKAMTITAVLTYAIKYGAQRHGPMDDAVPDPRIWEGPFGRYVNTSFPSGHAAMSWALATVIASEYSYRLWVPFVSYGLATLASASRVYEDEHWSSDVFFGAALGFFIGKFVYKSSEWCPGLMVIPGISFSGRPGFILSYRL